MPAHTHAVTDPGHEHTNPIFTSSGVLGGNRSFHGSAYDSYGATKTTSRVTSGITIAAAGGSTGHSHTVSSIGTIPPYYALAFIQKIS